MKADLKEKGVSKVHLFSSTMWIINLNPEAFAFTPSIELAFLVLSLHCDWISTQEGELDSMPEMGSIHLKDFLFL